MTDIWTKSTFHSCFHSFPKILVLLLNVSEEYTLFVSSSFSSIFSSFASIVFYWVFWRYQENNVAHLLTDIYFAILNYLKTKVNLLVLTGFAGHLTEPWAIQPFAILAEGSSRHFHPPGHNQCYLVLCSLLSRPNVLNLLIWKTSNVIWLSNCSKSKYK